MGEAGSPGGLHLGSQSGEVDIEMVVIAEPVAPYTFDQLLTGEYPPRVLRQGGEQVELDPGEAHRFAVEGDGAALQIDPQAVRSEGGGGIVAAAESAAAEHRGHLGGEQASEIGLVR